MGADVVVDLVDPPVVPVHRGEPSTQVAPLLATVPGELVLAAMVVEVVPVHRGEPSTQVAPLLATVPGELVLAAMVVEQVVDTMTSPLSLGLNSSLLGRKCDPLLPGLLYNCTQQQQQQQQLNTSSSS
nr:unnamed protein product [Digitaria exilis]